MKELLMPKFGAAMESGVISEWFFAVGDTVAKGDELCEISSEKITNTVPSLWDGVLEQILIEEGDEAACGAIIAVINEA